MRKLLIAIGVFVLVGCSTSPVPVNKADAAPSQRVLKYQSPHNGDTKLTVIRDSGITGSACYATVFVNGDKAALLNTSEKATLYLPPGEYEIGTAFDGSGFCSMGKERQERTVVLKSNQSKVVRIFTDGSGNLDIKPSTL